MIGFSRRDCVLGSTRPSRPFLIRAVLIVLRYVAVHLNWGIVVWLVHDVFNMSSTACLSLFVCLYVCLCVHQIHTIYQRQLPPEHRRGSSCSYYSFILPVIDDYNLQINLTQRAPSWISHRCVSQSTIKLLFYSVKLWMCSKFCENINRNVSKAIQYLHYIIWSLVVSCMSHIVVQKFATFEIELYSAIFAKCRKPHTVRVELH